MNTLLLILMFIAGAAIGGIIGYQHAIINSLKAQLGIDVTMYTLNEKKKYAKIKTAGFVACCIAWAVMICIATGKSDVKATPEADAEPETTVSETTFVQDAVEAAKLPVQEAIENKVEYFDVPLEEGLQDHIFELCEKRGLDPAIVIAMIRAESSYHADSIGDSGSAMGLMQIWPRWHQKRMDEYNCQNLLDPYQNVTVGIDIIADLNDKGKGIEWALMAYNAGGAKADSNRAAGIVNGYASKVLRYASELERV